MSQVLLIEDNRADEELTVRAFKKVNLKNEIVVVRDGREALDYLFGMGVHAARARADLPAVILLDLKLPRVHGLEVLRQIRADERTRLLPVVILSGSREEDDMVRSYSLGAAHVRKPVDVAEFLEAAKTLGLFWLLFNAPPSPPRGAT
jgi:two-component system response regulator